MYNKSVPKKELSRALQQNLSCSNLSSRISARVKPVHISKPLLQRVSQITAKQHNNSMQNQNQKQSIIDHLGFSKASVPEGQLRRSDRTFYQEQIRKLKRRIKQIQSKQGFKRNTTPTRQSQNISYKLQIQSKTIELLKQENSNLQQQLVNKETQKRHGSFSMNQSESLNLLDKRIQSLTEQVEINKNYKKQLQQQIVQTNEKLNKSQQERLVLQRKLNQAIQQINTINKKNKKLQTQMQQYQHQSSTYKLQLQNQRTINSQKIRFIQQSYSKQNDQIKLLISKYQQNQLKYIQQIATLKNVLSQKQSLQPKFSLIQQKYQSLQILLKQKQLQLQQQKQTSRTQRYSLLHQRSANIQQRWHQSSQQIQRFQQQKQQLLKIIRSQSKQIQANRLSKQQITSVQGLQDQNAKLTQLNIERLNQIKNLRLKLYQLQQKLQQSYRQLSNKQQRYLNMQNVLNQKLLKQQQRHASVIQLYSSQLKIKFQQQITKLKGQHYRLRDLLQHQQQNNKRNNQQMQEIINLFRNKNEQISQQLKLQKLDKQKKQKDLSKFKQDLNFYKTQNQGLNQQIIHLEDDLKKLNNQQKQKCFINKNLKQQFKRKALEINNLQQAMHSFVSK